MSDSKVKQLEYDLTKYIGQTAEKNKTQPWKLRLRSADPQSKHGMCPRKIIPSNTGLIPNTYYTDNRFAYTHYTDLFKHLAEYDQLHNQDKIKQIIRDPLLSTKLNKIIVPLWVKEIYGSFGELRCNSDEFINTMWKINVDAEIDTNTRKNCNQNLVQLKDDEKEMCLACGYEITYGQAKECDHLIPIIQAYISLEKGQNREFVWLHKTCNGSKSDMSIYEFIAAIENDEFKGLTSLSRVSRNDRVNYIKNAIESFTFFTEETQIENIKFLEEVLLRQSIVNNLSLNKLEFMPSARGVDPMTGIDKNNLLKYQWYLINENLQSNDSDRKQLEVENNELIEKLKQERADAEARELAHEKDQARAQQQALVMARGQENTLTLSLKLNERLVQAHKQDILQKNAQVAQLQTQVAQLQTQVAQLQAQVAQLQAQAHAQVQGREGRGRGGEGRGRGGGGRGQGIEKRWREYIDQRRRQVQFGKSTKLNKTKLNKIKLNKTKFRKLKILAKRYSLKINKSLLKNLKEIHKLHKLAKKNKIKITKTVRGKRIYKTIKELKKQLKNRTL